MSIRYPPAFRIQGLPAESERTRCGDLITSLEVPIR